MFFLFSFMYVRDSIVSEKMAQGGNETLNFLFLLTSEGSSERNGQLSMQRRGEGRREQV